VKIGPFLVLCAACVWLCSSCTPPEERAAHSYQAGVTDTAAGSDQAALKEFSHAVKLDPVSVPAHMARAQAEVALKDPAKAIDDYTEVITLDPSNEPAFFLRGNCEASLGDYPSAINDYNSAIGLNPDDAAAYFALGTARAKMADWDDALVDFGVAVRLQPWFEPAYRARAGAEVVLKDYEQALADASKAIELDGTDEFAWRIRAEVKSRLKDRQGAMADAGRAIELKPSDPSAYLARAGIAISWDDFSAADADLQRAMQMNPTNGQIYVYRGEEELKLRNPGAALENLHRALGFVPPATAASIFETIGNIEDDYSQWPDALESYRRSLAINPARDYLHFHIFLARCRLGQTADAQTELDGWLQSVPPNKAQDWTTSIGNYLAGHLAEKDFLSRATTTAKRTTDISGQICEADYYIGMKHLLAGDKSTAAACFQKAADTKEDNYFEYRSARAQLQALQNP
jgi:tetratricopeptide (TPR) repeat protein